MVLYGPWSFIHLVISAPAARSSWAAWLWLFIQANIRGVTLSQSSSWDQLKVFASSVVSYPFSSSESTLAPLRNNNVSSSWHPELGGALARPSLHQLGVKGVSKIVGGFQKFALRGGEGWRKKGPKT